MSVNKKDEWQKENVKYCDMLENVNEDKFSINLVILNVKLHYMHAKLCYFTTLFPCSGLD